MATRADIQQRITSLAAFIDASPTPAHAVAAASKLLDNAHAERLDPKSAWKLAYANLYYVVINSRTLVAFRTPAKSSSKSLPGFTILGAHTDSPCLRIKERSVSWETGLLVTGTEPYGALIQSTWLDRDLHVGGVVSHRTISSADSKKNDRKNTEETGIETSLVDLNVHVTIPNLAIHLNREINKGVEYNPQTQLRVITRVEVPEQYKNTPWEYLCASRLGIAVEDLLSLDLYLSDAKPAQVASENDGSGLFSAPRIDNLSGANAVLEALVDARPGVNVQLAALFDHEEIGSRSAQGADSGLLPQILQRIWATLPETNRESDAWFRVLANSWIVSVDAAHARHPNYADKHDSEYAPLLNKGIVLKSNVNHRYATQSQGAAWFSRLCALNNVPLQRFTNRADMGCGSTIGPLSTSLAGIPGIDIGIPMLAMHSARECSGTADHSHMIRALTAVLEEESPGA